MKLVFWADFCHCIFGPCRNIVGAPKFGSDVLQKMRRDGFLLQSTSDWLHLLPRMVVVVFGVPYLGAAAIYLGVRLALLTSRRSGDRTKMRFPSVHESACGAKLPTRDVC
jgi:hypothetical protein